MDGTLPRKRDLLASLLLSLPLAAAGCYGDVGVAHPSDPGLLERGLPIVSVSRELPPEMLSKRASALRSSQDNIVLRTLEGSRTPREASRPTSWAAPHALDRRVSALEGPESFYLAINRNDLGKRFFLTAFLEVEAEANVQGAAASSLGTRVVSFRVQNNKLFVFDVRDNRATSDTFDPRLILEAYPIVQGFAPFKVLPGNQNYILFDPAAGLNRFHPILSDAVEPGDPTWQFEVDLSYMQGFRQIADGATFQQVFTGTLEDAARTFPRQWGTLGVALRRYAEGPGFEPFPVSADLPPHYYPDEAHREANTGSLFGFYSRFNLRREGRPIQYLMSPQWLQLVAELPQYDWIGAVKAGVESWNEALGFTALEAKLAGPDDSFAHDDKSFIIFDRDPSVPYAFANWRSNPNTGEIRGASVYFGGSWIDTAIELFDPPPPPAMGAPAIRRRQPAAPAAGSGKLAFGWGGLQPRLLCQRALPSGIRRQPAPPVVGFTPKQRLEAFITHIVAHEVGHTLGLQHNFKASLDDNSSVMEYMPDELTHLRFKPGPYDAAAVKFLYGLAPQPPQQRFCNDQAAAEDPRCAVFDDTDEPLGKYWTPLYTDAAQALLRDEEIERLGLNGLAGFFRAGDEADQLRAWQVLSAPFKIGIDPTLEEAAHPGYTERLNDLQKLVLDRLFFSKEEERGEVVADPAPEGMALQTFAADLQNTVLDSDGLRSWTVRRTSVDVLKKLQVQPAYEALLSARGSLATARAGLTGEEASLTDDLLARIDRAIKPYFEQ
jgi:Met-zincin